MLEDVSRHVAPRPVDVDVARGPLDLLPVFICNSATESEIIDEMKEKVRATVLATHNWTVVSTLCLKKNDTDVAGYIFNAHQPILVVFGRDVGERVCY